MTIEHNESKNRVVCRDNSIWMDLPVNFKKNSMFLRQIVPRTTWWWTKSPRRHIELQVLTVKNQGFEGSERKQRKESKLVIGISTVQLRTTDSRVKCMENWRRWSSFHFWNPIFSDCSKNWIFERWTLHKSNKLSRNCMSPPSFFTKFFFYW